MSDSEYISADEVNEVAKRYGISPKEAHDRIKLGTVVNNISFAEVAESLSGNYKPVEQHGDAVREPLHLAYDDMPFEALDRVAAIAYEGMRRYGKDNWCKGIPQSNCFNHAIEHLRKWEAGYSDEDHLAKAAWNILAMIALDRSSR